MQREEMLEWRRVATSHAIPGFRALSKHCNVRKRWNGDTWQHLVFREDVEIVCENTGAIGSLKLVKPTKNKLS